MMLLGSDKADHSRIRAPILSFYTQYKRSRGQPQIEKRIALWFFEDAATK